MSEKIGSPGAATYGAVLTASNVVKSYAGRPVLRGVSLELRAGERLP